MSDVTITITSPQAGQAVADSGAGEAPPPDTAMGGQAGALDTGAAGPAPSDLGSSGTAETEAGPPPLDAMGLANGAHFAGGEGAPAPIPLQELDDASGATPSP